MASSPSPGTASTTTPAACAEGPGSSPTRVSERIPATYNVVIAQPATFCNIDCDYCYLPGRDRQNRMPVPVARAIADSISGQKATHEVAVAWHGGEPLTTGIDHFETLLSVFEPLRRNGRVQHTVQTNATLINDRWCRLFERYRIGVGVSVDGPAALNTSRTDRRGRETFERTMRGIQALKDHGIPFNVIAVVTPETIGRAREFLDFFDRLGCMSLAVNIEEREGANTGRPLVTRADAVRFWREVITYLRGSELKVRELTALATYLAAKRAGKREWTTRQAVPAVAWNGDVVVLSPELAGNTAAGYGNFSAGSILRTSLGEILAGMDRLRYVREFAAGLARCEAECTFWDYCRGAHACNRFFEHGTFTATETAHCRNTMQAPVIALRSLIKEEANHGK